MTDTVAVGVVMVAYGDEPLLREAVEAVLASQGVDVTLALVDNGCENPALPVMAARDDVILLRPGRNTGFTGGCNLGAAAVSGHVLVFVNSDAVLDPDALRALCDALKDSSVGLACGQVVLYHHPDIVNTVGNPVHYTLMSWAGGWGDRAVSHDQARDVAAASGCMLAIDHSFWDRLGGFNERLFAYGEDTELSLRTWLDGRRVRYVPAARARHAFEFSRNPDKYYLLERNRWITLVTVYETRTLLLLAPALLLLEAGTTLAAASGGWLRQKARAWGWLLDNAAELRQRRREVQVARRHGDEVLVPLLAARIEPAAAASAHVPRPINDVFDAYWRLVAPRISRRRVDQRAARSRSTARTLSAAWPSP